MKIQSLMTGIGHAIADISAIVNFFLAYFYHGVPGTRRNHGTLLRRECQPTAWPSLRSRVE